MAGAAVEADGGQLAATLVGHTGVVWGSAPSDGRLAASSSRDNNRLWVDSHQGPIWRATLGSSERCAR
jgi:hypothetical protein